MKTLLLDADGVFVDFVKGYLEAVFQVTGKRFTQDQITGFDIGKALGLTPEEVEKVKHYIQPGFCESLDPLPGAIEAIQRLMLITDVYVVTSPFDSLPTWDYERRAWIKKHLGLGKNKIWQGSSKHMIRGDFFVDDRAENCVEWDAHNAGTAVIWESPWNVKHPWNGHRFNNWAKLETLIQNA